MFATISLKNKIALIAVCLSAVMLGLEITSVPSILPTLKELLPADFQQLQWIMNAYTIAMCSVLVAMGALADRFGRKKTLYILNIGAMMGYFLSGLAIYIPNFPLLLISRFITGAFSSRRGICMASLSDLSPDEKSRSKNFGIIATLGGVSWIFSIFI